MQVISRSLNNIHAHRNTREYHNAGPAICGLRSPFLAFGLLLIFLVSCSSEESSNQADPALPTDSGLSGNLLSEKYCTGCHSLVTPGMLPKPVWEDLVLPAMGLRLGMNRESLDSLFGLEINSPILKAANIPEQPQLSKSDWDKLVNYFLDNSPDTIPGELRSKNITMGLRHFKFSRSQYSHTPAHSALVKILPDNRGFIFSDGKRNINRLTFLTNSLDHDYDLTLKGLPVHYFEKSDNVFLGTIGLNIFPNHGSDGALYQLNRTDPAAPYSAVKPVLTGLKRPVSFDYGDLNGDGLLDIVVCEFGNLTGALAWFENTGDNQYKKRILRRHPGAIKAIINDFNGDSYPDVLALMAQGDEGIFLFENQGGGIFQEKKIVTYSPLFGSQYMELADFNSDGKADILYVCGDNADKSPILKEYHGIYIYLNQGNFEFSQAYFYHLNGAYKALPRDYDLDGDLDIACISYYPDYQNYPQESFVYLENAGGLDFSEFTFPEATSGRWIVMDAEDMDGDGDIDLALGSNVYFKPKNGPSGLSEKWSEIGPSMIVLENTIH